MKPLGKKFPLRALEGHQGCPICQDEAKPPCRAREKQRVTREIEMEMPKLGKVFESVFHGQVYRLDGVGYDVPKLTYYCRDNIPEEDVPLADLHMSQSDEEHGSREFVKHAKKTNPNKFPIVVVRLRDGNLQIADGNHRAWKAAASGEKTIRGHVIDQDDLPDEAVVEFEGIPLEGDEDEQ